MADQTTAADYSRLNPALGVIGMTMVGILLIWYPLVVLKVPLPSNPVHSSLVTALWQTVTLIVLPYAWAYARLRRSPAALGVTTRNLVKSALLGCALYALALAAFLHCSSDPLVANHLVGHLDWGEAVLMVSAMSLIAAGTDFTTRGFILLTLADYTNVATAVAVQNLTWFLGHLHEIQLLSGCLGWGSAVGLTLTLGVLGDVIALKTRNVLGLALAHVMLNVVLSLYIRQL